ncbi:alpha/beta fold hydrolase [Paenibacillus beijingensis]|uniref:Peptidase n=1 Tax=Paenibacillus beijingensis TaxID=1126833 RepID=A0A0D5NNA0_9BACL|nr:alpha/beta fold hydrolase [Paenibacillus beijingensis]AJY76492.1 peptidase [Paenibacillus beijingensis]
MNASHHSKLGSKTASFLLTASLAVTLLFPAAAGAERADGAQAQSAIVRLTETGIIDGKTAGMSPADAPITRGQAAILISRALKLDIPADGSGFADVSADDPAAGAVNALKQHGIMKGGTRGFMPGEALTSEQMASLFVRAFALSDNGIQARYTDQAAIASYHQADAVRLKQHFIVEGTAFEPKHKVTYGEFALALYRAAGLDVRDPDVIPLEDFIRQPAQLGFQVSPDGKRMAFMMPWNNRLNVFVKTFGEQEAVRVTNATERNIAGFAWENDSKLIYAMDDGGNENFRIFSINTDGTGNKDLTPYVNTTAMLIDPLEEKKDEILVGLNKRDPRIFDVYRINTETGAAQMVAENPGNITGWLTDHDGKIRVAVSSDGNVSSLLYRETEDKPFQPLLTTELGDTFVPVMFTYDNKQLYAVSNIGRDKTAIVQYDPASKQTVSTIFEHADVDVTSFIPSKKQQKIVAALYETEKVHYQFFDPDTKKLYETIAGKVPGKDIILQSMNEQGRVMFLAYNDKSMGTYYFYDSGKDLLEKIADTAPWIDENKMADMKPITFESRDGLTIHGYLTLPKGKDPKHLPLVVNPHGGPWARDSWGFNPEVQLLANRGYAVLQVNFRGSTGYGKQFLDAGNKQWGKAMQNDLTDGVQWLIKEGVADPDKVAIYGASYGGYAALAGLAFTPDLYAAGVSYVGPSNLFTLLDSLPPYWESERTKFYERMGDPVKDKALLEEVSPLFHADQIKAPLFVVQGANDPRVKQAESDQIVAALQKRGVEVPYMLKANEGHGFGNIENQLDFYRSLEKFLHRHLME